MKLALVLAPSILIVSACSTSDATTEYSGPRSRVCSTGTPYAAEAEFPSFETQTPSETPQCMPRCDQGKKETKPYGMVFTIAALPSGTCELNGERCSFSAVRERICDDGERVHCSLSRYTCRCESQTWRCYQITRGASACICSDALPDGG